MSMRHGDRPIVLGIVGDSGTGKTTLATGIASILGRHRVNLLRTDDYLRYDRRERRLRRLTALDPECHHLDILEQHLRLLREGRPVLKPVYDHATGTLVRPEYLAPRPYLLVEGLLGYHSRAMRRCYDMKIFLEPEEALRRRWMVRRDTTRRGYGREQVLRRIERHRADREAHIRPQRVFADILVRFRPPEADPEESGARLDVRHLLRPTLAHADLSPILDGHPRSGIRLELARDIDGKPVDVLEISGDIPEARARRVEDLLWSLIPEASYLRGRVGSYGSGGREISHPLALTQLLIAYHTIKAAQGVVAI